MLPQALAADQPGSRALVRQRLLQLPACDVGRRQLPQPTCDAQGGAQGLDGRDRQGRDSGWAVLRQSMIGRATEALLGGLEQLGSRRLPEAERELLLET